MIRMIYHNREDLSGQPSIMAISFLRPKCSRKPLEVNIRSGEVVKKKKERTKIPLSVCFNSGKYRRLRAVLLIKGLPITLNKLKSFLVGWNIKF